MANEKYNVEKKKYNENPNLCKYCNKPIICTDDKKLSHVRKKKYCSAECYHADFKVYNAPGIYCIKNVLNNKIYVGQSVNIAERFREHKSHLSNNCHGNEYLQNAWNKYGENNFIFEILEKCSKEELDIKERYWIMYYNSNVRDYGYNYESGGHKNKKLSEETKVKISKNHCDVSGSNNPFYGKTHSAKSIDKFLNNPNYINRKHLGEDSHFAKLSLEQATYIKKYLKEHKTSYAEEIELAKTFNVGINAIQKIKHNRTWKQIVV